MSEDPSGWSSRLDDAFLVQWGYASRERLRTRDAICRDLFEGGNPEDVIVAAAAEVSPEQVLDIGCGAGELGERVARELGAGVIAADIFVADRA